MPSEPEQEPSTTSFELSASLRSRTDRRRSPGPGIRYLDGKFLLAQFHRISRDYALEAIAHVVDYIQIAVRTEGIAHAEVGAHCLVLRGIGLHKCGCVEKPVKGIADLYSRQFDIEISLGKPERIECVVHCEGEVWIRPVLSRQCSGIQSSRIVTAPLLGCGKRHPVISGRRVRHLVRCKSVAPCGNEHLFVQVQR